MWGSDLPHPGVRALRFARVTQHEKAFKNYCYRNYPGLGI